MIWYFRKGLKPSERVEMKQRDRELNKFDKIVKKTVDAEIKAALKLCSKSVSLISTLLKAFVPQL